jgi:hypothetical protein
MLAVARDPGFQRFEAVVPEFVVQFVQQVHADDFTVGPLFAEAGRPPQAVGFQQHPPAVHVVRVQRGAYPEVGHAFDRGLVQAMDVHGEDAAGRRFPVGEPQVQRLEAEFAPELAPMDHVSADAVGPPQQASSARHVAPAQGLAHGRARHAQVVHLVAVHAGHVEAVAAARRIEHRVVTRPSGAEAEVVAHQHVPRAEALHEDFPDEGLGNQARQARIELEDDALVDAAPGEFGELVAQGGHPGRRQFGLALHGGEVVARVRLEGQHAAGHAAVPRLVVQQRQHGLVAAVHAVEVADGHGAGGRDAGVVEASEGLHRAGRYLFDSTHCPCGKAPGRASAHQRRVKTGYIVLRVCEGA